MPLKDKKSHGGGGEPTLQDIPQGPLEDILSKLSLQELANVSTTSRAMQATVKQMPEYVFKKEYPRLRKALLYLRDSHQVLLELPIPHPENLPLPYGFQAPIIPQGARCVGLMLEVYDEGAYTETGESLGVVFHAIIEKHRYPDILGAVDVAGVEPPLLREPVPMFGKRYHPEKAAPSGETAAEAFLRGAQLLGSFRQGVTYLGDKQELMVAIMEKAGVPPGKVRLTTQVRQSRLPRIPGAGTAGHVTLYIRDPTYVESLVYELVKESGIGMSPESVPRRLRMVLFPSADMPYDAWRDAIARSPPPSYHFLMEADGPQGTMRLQLQAVGSSRSRATEIWSTSDPEELEHEIDTVLEFIMDKAGYYPGSIQLEGTDAMAHRILDYILAKDTENISRFYGKNYK